MNKHEQACNRVSRQCLVIRDSREMSFSVCRHSGEMSFSVCRGRFAFKETLFSIALFSLCSLNYKYSELCERKAGR